MKHLIIPDTQVKPRVPLQHFSWIGRYIADKGPDVVVHLGDFRDMPSLSAHDSPTRKAFEHRCKKDDIDSGNLALELLENELEKRGVQPDRKVLLRGNHDGATPLGRIGRYLCNNPEDRKLITDDMFLEYKLGWEVHEFLKIVEINGILYSHLFPYGATGRVSASSLRFGAANPLIQIKNTLQSSTAGHSPGLQTAFHATPRTVVRGIIAGSCYQHDEESFGPIGNRVWRGILVKHDIRKGNPHHYDLMEVSLEYLKQRYS